jgi:hypothetical protein
MRRRRRRLPRILLNAATVASLILCAASAFCWHASRSRDGLCFDLVHWNGNERGFLDDGLGFRARYGQLALLWLRVRGGVAPSRAGDADDPPFDPADYPAHCDECMPGLGDGRAGAAGPPGRWNLLPPFVCDFIPRYDNDYLYEPLIETSWGLRANIETRTWRSIMRDEPGNEWSRLTIRHAAAPFWLVTALFVLTPTLHLAATACRRLAHRHHPRPGTCPSCGYDLRATPARCPECGTVPPPPPSA